MKKYRYYIECASGVLRGVLSARNKADAERQLKASFARNRPNQSIWVWYVTEE